MWIVFCNVRHTGLVILEPNTNRASFPDTGALPAWSGIARPAWLLALITGLLIVGFQTRLQPPPPHAGPAKLSFASAAPVRFPMPERLEQGQDQPCEPAAFILVLPAAVAFLETKPAPVPFADARVRAAMSVRAPPRLLS